jgi:hypothetical protein
VLTENERLIRRCEELRVLLRTALRELAREKNIQPERFTREWLVTHHGRPFR